MDYKYFPKYELKCRGASCCGGSAPMQKVFMERMIMLRELVGILQVNSAYRCEIHNAFVGGAPKSYHKEGLAIDVWSKSQTLGNIALTARKLGLHTIMYKDFVHIDGRGL